MAGLVPLWCQHRVVNSNKKHHALSCAAEPLGYGHLTDAPFVWERAGTHESGGHVHKQTPKAARTCQSLSHDPLM